MLLKAKCGMFHVIAYCFKGNIQVYVERLIDCLHSSYAMAVGLNDAHAIA